MSDLLTYFESRQQQIIDLLTQLVQHESFTADVHRVNQLADFITVQLEEMSADSVTRIPQENVGDIVVGKWNEAAPGKPILVLMHMDTVWPIGTLANRPVTQDDEGRLYGPGVLDMKGGLAVAMSAVQGLAERDELPQRPIWMMFTSDEEIGSAESEPYIREYAQQCGLALVMEFPTPDGALKTGRKGVASYELTVQGRASHAGNHPEEGVNAILEMSQQIVSISKMQDLRNGISVAVNTIEGGRATNVIAPDARATIDVRTFNQFDMDHIHEELTNLYPKTPGAKVEARLKHMRGPMERTEQIAAAFQQCKQIAWEMGVTVTEDTVGGGSDGNITAGIGVPTIDGLGPLGAGAHAEHEHVIVRSLPVRAAHIAAILRDWQFDQD